LPSVSDAKKKQKKARTVWQTYRVNHGDTLTVVAKHLGVSVKKLRTWNRLKKTRTLKHGQRLKFKAKRLNSQSRGRPNQGTLKGGINLDPDGDRMGLGWAIAKRRKAIWGTPELIKSIKRCGREYRRYFPIGKGAPFAVGDLSARFGGRLPPHVSHQSGRDADIGVVRKKPARNGIFLNTRPSDMDLYKNWVLIKCFLDDPNTKLIILDRTLVKALEKYIRRIYGKKRAKKLNRYLSYFPGGKTRVILPDDEHKSHFHVRVKCAKDDTDCRG